MSAGTTVAPAVPATSPRRPLGLADVVLEGGFWGDRQEVNSTATIPHIADRLEHFGWIENFDLAAQGRVDDLRGREFADSEVYKLLEAMAWELGRREDAATAALFDDVVTRVAAAQAADGYLHTRFGRPGQPARYADLTWGHELYCTGHLIQAGVARARTAGLDDPLVRTAVAAADHVCEEFGPDGRDEVCGHPCVETALAELARVTGTARYLDQARLFVRRHGRSRLRDGDFGPRYFQDDEPVLTRQVLAGHAVRALYLAAGAADVATDDADDDLLGALRTQWSATVARRTHLTGGMGSRHHDESFGQDFELPADRAYCESCAGVASVMLAWRLLLADEDDPSAYADLVERTLYNVVAAAVSRDGTRFFYSNTLHRRESGDDVPADAIVGSPDSSVRAPWYDVSCCPANLARLIASLGSYVATTTAGTLELHQLVGATVRTDLDGVAVGVTVRSGLPEEGRVVVTVDHAEAADWILRLRVPAWAGGATLTTPKGTSTTAPGYAEVHGLRAGDRVVLDVPVEPRLVAPDPRIDALRHCVALERGPEVLCLESLDLPERHPMDAVTLDPTSPLVERDGEVVAALRLPLDTTSPWPYAALADEDAPRVPTRPVTLRPYHGWGHRGPTQMRVWLPVG